MLVKRFASTTTTHSSTAYLPSVSWLIHKHKLSNELVSSIPTTGPKNRLLKGDVLAFLHQGGVELDVLLENESYYSTQINVPRKAFTTKTILDVGNLISLAALGELGDKGLHPKSTTTIISKQSILGQTDYQLDVPNLSLKTLALLKGQSDLRSAPGSFRIIDSLALGDRFNDTVNHISQGEVAVLSISSQDAPKSSFSDLITRSSPSVSTVSSSEFESSSPVQETPQDLLDFLAPAHSTPSSIQLELTADSRSVSSKTATKFLANVKAIVEGRL